MIDLREADRIRVINEYQRKGTTVTSDLTGLEEEAKLVLRTNLYDVQAYTQDERRQIGTAKEVLQFVVRSG